MPTYICSSSGEPNTLDLVLGNSLICPYFLSCQTVGDIGSDHFPVVSLLDLDIKKAEVKPTVNFTQWVKKIDEALPKLCMDGFSVDDQVDIIEKVFKSTKSKCTHRVVRPKRKLPHEIMTVIKQRKSLLAKRKKASSQQERAEITKEYNKINNKVKYQIEQFEEQEKEKLATDICDAKDTTQMWRLFKRYKTRNKECIEPIAPLELPNGKVTTSNTEKSTEFARHLESVHQTPNDPTCNLEFKREIDSYFSAFTMPPPCEDGLQKIDVRQFREILAQTKSNSSPGEDTITYDILKRCNDNSIQTLCQLINKCLTENVFPTKWKCAKVIMVPKPGKDPKKATSYRPISLISCLGKIYERYICENLVNVLSDKQFFSSVQAGYQKGKSAEEHIFRLTQDIYNGFKERKCTVGIFLDVQKAFDSVWINGLKLKIKKLGLSIQLQNILFSFVTNRHLKVNVDGIDSNQIQLNAGTPQGSCLSPVLYLIFVNDLTDLVDQSKTAANQYADDVGLYSTDRSLESAKTNVQAALNSVMKWCQKWQVIMNAQKSQVILFSKCPTHKKEDVKLMMYNTVIPVITQVTYLGVVFDSKLSWEKQVSKIASKAYGRLNLLRAISSLSAKHNPTLLAQLYNSTIRSIFEHSSICIVSAANTHLDKLQLIQNECLRVILKVPAYMPISRMNDCGNQTNVKQHLISVAKEKVRRLFENSSHVRATVEKYRSTKNSKFNTSPLDIIQL